MTRTGLLDSRIPWLWHLKRKVLSDDGKVRWHTWGVRWDFVTGCNNSEEVCAPRRLGYCWAKNAAERRAREEYLRDQDCVRACQKCDRIPSAFAPTFHEERLEAPLLTQAPKVIGTVLGGDLWCPGVKQEWRDRGWDVVRECDEREKGHVFVCLTKQPGRIRLDELPYGDNIWIGVSVTSGADLLRIVELWLQASAFNKRWVSFEPVLEPVVPGEVIALKHGLLANGIRWAVIGGTTDGRGRILQPDEPYGTRAEWVQPLLDGCHAAKVPVFVKGLRKEVWEKLHNPWTREPVRSLREPTLRQLPPEWLAVGRSEGDGTHAD